jgi:2-C-methyl-D-erythritol 2,4-cyclodiphosphate synthase
MKDKIRIGTGYDIHPLVHGRKLILGGVPVPYEKGLDGWSDADVLVHAVIDALLGAAGQGDIGSKFPAGDPLFEGISSLYLLGQVKVLLEENGWAVGNIDATIIAEKPSLASYKEIMSKNIADTLDIDSGRVNIKATTNEKLGSLGRGEGIAAQSVALLEKF